MDEQIVKYLIGELHSEQRLELLRRIEKDASLKADFIRLQNIHALSQLAVPCENNEEIGKKFEAFRLAIRRGKQKKVILNTLKYAAVAALLVISTYLTAFYLFEKSASTATSNTLFVPAGQRACLTLEDGTKVWLNAQSTLIYPARFGNKQRRVSVSGEAYFEVAKDAKRPFMVSAKQIQMEVLGTTFNVSAYAKDDFVKTSLLEGSLRVWDINSDNRKVILTPNQQITLSKGKMNVEQIAFHDYFLWKEGIYSFNNESLENIIEKLQMYYDTHILITGDLLREITYTGKFRQRDGIEEILRLIQKIHYFDISIDRENNIITINK